MNGRLYDPILGRFISADPIIQDPTDLQSLNRYTYVRNNPLSMTDPSGYSWLSKQWKRAKDGKFSAFGVIGYSHHLNRQALKEFGRFARKNKYVAEITTVAGCIATAPLGPAGCAAVSAAVTYAVTDGDMQATARAGATSFISAGASQGISYAAGGNPSALMSWKTAAVVTAHATLGGTMSVMNGGKFGAGALAGAFGKLASVGFSTTGMFPGSLGDRNLFNVAARTAMVAIAGGVASELGGGSFGTGAVTAAMQHLFNGEKLASIQENGSVYHVKKYGACPPTSTMCLIHGANWNRTDSSFTQWSEAFGDRVAGDMSKAFGALFGLYGAVSPSNSLTLGGYIFDALEVYYSGPGQIAAPAAGFVVETGLKASGDFSPGSKLPGAAGFVVETAVDLVE